MLKTKKIAFNAKRFKNFMTHRRVNASIRRGRNRIGSLVNRNLLGLFDISLLRSSFRTPFTPISVPINTPGSAPKWNATQNHISNSTFFGASQLVQNTYLWATVALANVEGRNKCVTNVTYVGKWYGTASFQEAVWRKL